MKRNCLIDIFHRLIFVFPALMVIGLTGCKKTPEPKPDDGSDDPDEPEEIVHPELRNQFALGNDTLDIRTALWEQNDKGNYLIYLTPRSGIEYFDDLMAEEDFVSLEVAKVDASFEAGKDLIELKYGNFRITSENMAKADTLGLSVLMNTSSLKISADVQLGKQMFAARYDGSVSEFTPVSLNNEWEQDRERTSIGSVVESHRDGQRFIYLYHGENIKDTPEENGLSDYIMIRSAEDLYGEFDLSQTAEELEIRYHELSSSEADKVSGSLNILIDKSGKKMSVLLESIMDRHELRMSWSGERWIDYEMENRFELTPLEGKSIAMGLKTVFMEEDRRQTTRIAFGVHENPAQWEDLKDRYAIQFNVLNVGETIDLKNNQGYGLQIFDYENFKTYDASELGAEGSILVFDDPNGDSHKIGFTIDATLGNGIQLRAEWFGTVVPTDAFDLTPVAPKTSLITITDKDGRVTEQLPVTGLKVIDRPSFQSQFTGAVFHAKEFYFINQNSNEGNLEASTTPILAVNVSCVGSEDIDLTKEVDLFDFRYTPFNSSGIASPSEWSGTTTYGRLTVLETEDGGWKIRFEVKDFGDWWGLGNPTGSESTIVIEWEGLAIE